MGRNKPWKRQAKRIWGYCCNEGYKYYYCNYCHKFSECFNIFGCGGSDKHILMAYKHVKNNRIKKHKELMQQLKEESERRKHK